MLELGGNAIDAFAAMSFAISVERPHSTGLGGGGFLLYLPAGKKTPLAFDFREEAPRRAKANMYLDKNGNAIPNKSLVGALASGVPGTVAGVLHVHKKFGKLPLATVMEPAISLAEKGFPVYAELAGALQDSAETLRKFPSSAAIFLHKDGSPLKEGELLVQTDLANTLRTITKNGAKGFYEGKIANELAASQKKWGGIITMKDLARYKVKERKAVHTDFKGYEIYSMPPPSSGGVHVLEALNMLEGDDLKKLGAFSPEAMHLVAASLQQAFADRAKYLGDPDFVKVPVEGLLRKTYAHKLRAKFLNRARHMEEVSPGNPLPFEPSHTTHFSLIDKNGNAVSSTQTINGYFGSGLVADGTGVLFNNEMDDFAAKEGASNLFGAVGGKNNLIAPRKRPLSSMAPTIVLEKGKPVLATGSPSGTRIISCVLESILNYLVYKMPLDESVAAPRYHHQWSPDEIRIDELPFPSATLEKLESMGYKINRKNLGCRVEAVAHEGENLISASDPRAFGSALAH